MADPVSICLSVAAAAKIVYQSSVSLYAFVEGVTQVDQSVLALLEEFSSLKNVSFAISDTVSSASIRDQAWLDDSVQDVFTLLESSLKACHASLESFKEALTEIKNSRFSTKVLRQPITQVKLDLKSTRIAQLRAQIVSHLNALQLGLQTINLSASIRGPEMVIDVLSSKINDDMSNLSHKVDGMLDGFDTRILERMNGLERLVTQSSQRLNAQYMSYEDVPGTQNEIRLKEVAQRVVSSARSIISSKSTVADDMSVYGQHPYQAPSMQSTSLYGSVLGEEKLQGIAQWSSGLDTLVEGSETSIGLESSNWTAATNDSDSEDDMADDMFNAFLEKGEQHYDAGKYPEAEIAFRKALKTTNTAKLRPGSAQKLNDMILKLANLYSEQAKFAETKEVLLLFTLSKVDLSPWEVQQKIKASHLLAKAHLELTELNEAEVVCKECMRARRRTFGKNSPEYQESLKLLLAIHEAQGDDEPPSASPLDESGERSGRTSVASSFSSMNTLTPTFSFTGTQARPPSRVDYGFVGSPSSPRTPQSPRPPRSPRPISSPQVTQLRPSSLSHSHLNPFESPKIAGASQNNGQDFTRSMSLTDEGSPTLPFKHASQPSADFVSLFSSIPNQNVQAKESWGASLFPNSSDVPRTSQNVDTSTDRVPLALSPESSNQLKDQKNEVAALSENTLPAIPPKIKVEPKTKPYFPDETAFMTPSDQATLEKAFWTLEVKPSYGFLVVGFMPQNALVIAARERHVEVLWALSTRLADVEKRYLNNLRYRILTDVVRSPDAFPTKLDLNWTDSKGPLLFQILWPNPDDPLDTTTVATAAPCQMATMLLNAGGDPNLVFNKETALLRACSNSQWSFMDILLHAGADTSCTDKNNHTALYLAVASADPDAEKAVCQLVHRGADVHISFQGGSITALTHVVRSNWPEATGAFLKAGANPERKSGTQFDSPLGGAVALELLPVVKILLVGGAKLEGKSWYKNTYATPLYIAARIGSHEMTHLLLGRGSYIEAKDTIGQDTPLSIAAYKGLKPIVKMLLEKQAQVDSRDDLSRTPLSLVCCSGYVEIVHMLLGRGADVNALDEKGRTPLYFAAEFGHEDVVEVLLEHNAKTDIKAESSLTAQSVALGKGHKSIVQLIEKHVSKEMAEPRMPKPLAEVEGKTEDKNEEFPVEEEQLPEMDNTPLISAAKAGDSKLVKNLLSSGADVEARGRLSHTALTIAAQNGHTKIVSLLLDAKADCNAKQEDEYTALYLAAWGGHDKIAQMLIAQGADIECAPNIEDTERQGFTPLCIAASKGHKKVVKLLLAANANIEAVTVQTESRPIHLATQHDYWETIDLLIAKGANIEARDIWQTTPLHWAAFYGYRWLSFNSLLEAGAETAVIDDEMNTPLHAAAGSGHASMLKDLVEYGGDLEAVEENGFTPIYKAARNGHKKCVKILFEKGAKIEAKGFRGLRSLHAAAKYGHTSVVEFLLDKGASINPGTEDTGHTPLAAAAEHEHLDTVKLLLKRKADPNLPKGGKTPLKWAIEKGNKDIEKLLKAYGAVDTPEAAGTGGA